MRGIIMAGAALALIGATVAHADDSEKKVVGEPTGVVAGVAIGAEAAVPDDARAYVMDNPTPPVALEGQVTADTRFDETVKLNPIPNHPDLAYIYVNNRPVIVRTDSRQAIYAPDVAPTASIPSDIPETTITYVEHNPLEPVVLEGPIEAGVLIPDTVQIVGVPENPSYGYIYVDGRPVLVDIATREVIWVR